MTYYGDWENEDSAIVLSSFNLSASDQKYIMSQFEIMHAYYSYENYSGEAFVILRSRHDDSLWEVNGSHCSCHGLEGQWELESTSLDALIKRHKARPLPGMHLKNSASWLVSMIEKKEISKTCQDPLSINPTKKRI